MVVNAARHNSRESQPKLRRVSLDGTITRDVSRSLQLIVSKAIRAGVFEFLER
jgi:hypothetical protein